MDTVPKDIILLLFCIIDVKSLLSLSLTSKFLGEVHLKEALLILRAKIEKLTKLDISNYQLTQLYNVYRLLKADVSISETHSLLLNAKGEVYTFDLPKADELKWDINLKMIPNVNNIREVLAGDKFSFLLRDDDKFVILNSTNPNSAVINHNIGKVRSFSETYDIIYAISEDCKVYQYCHDIDNKTLVEFKLIIDDSIDAVRLANYFWVLTSNNIIHRLDYDVYWYEHDQIRFDSEPSIIKISSDLYQIVLLRSDGRVLWSPESRNGKFGLVENLCYIIDVVISNSLGVALDKNGNVHVWHIMEDGRWYKYERPRTFTDGI